MLDLEPQKLPDTNLHKKQSNGKIIISGSNCILMKKKKTSNDSSSAPSLTPTETLKEESKA